MAPLVRLLFLDHLRVLALGLLVLYHVGMYYVRWDWHVKSPQAGPAIEPLMLLLNPWRMSLLFLVSGAVTALLLGRAGPGWLGARLRRLGLPLLAGMLVVVPPQSWWQVREQFGYAEGYLAFLGRYLRADGGFCAPGGACLVLPTWNHLWFLPYLMVYTLGLWALHRRWPAALARAGTWLAPRLGPVAILIAPLALLAALRLALRPWFPVTHALVDDPLAHAQYLPAFLIGALWAVTPGAWAAVARWRHVALGLLLAGWAMALLPEGRLPLPGLRLGFALQQWGGVVAAVGLAHRYLDRPSPLLAQAARWVFPVYVLHQTLIIGAAVLLRPLAWPPAAEALVLVLAGSVGALAVAGLAVRVPGVAPWLGARAR